jgi:3-oxoacyl-[acyl-carrier protein] reductase
MGRFGTMDEVVNVFIFLASEAASYITGESVDLNGGWLID